MKQTFLLFHIVLLSYCLASCNKKSYEDCRVDFKIEFINKNTGECYQNKDSLLSAYGLDTMCLYIKPKHSEEIKEYCLYRDDEDISACIFIAYSGIDFDKTTNPTFTYFLGKSPYFLDTIEFKYNGSSAEVLINGVLQENRAICRNQIKLNIIK